MSSDFPRTVLLDVSGFPASANRNVIATAITNRFASLKVMAVQFVGNVARVSFADPAAKQLILRNESIVIGDIPCRVRGRGPSPQKVFVYNFPFEAKNELLARALNKFGEVKDVFNRCWLHLNGVADGVRVVSMVRNQAIPRNLDVEGFRVKVSYYGQAVECDICERLGHVARDCPLKGKCLWCHQPGHLARECVNPRADSSDIPDDHPADTPSVATPSEVAQPTPPADSNNESNDSPTSVSSPVLFDSADVGSATEGNVSPAGFSGDDDDISDSFSVDSISDMDQSNVDKARNVKESNVNIKQGTGNIEQSGNEEHSRSNVVESMNNDKDIEQSMNNGKDIEQSMNNGKDIEQNTVIVEQSTSNVVQSSINVQQSIDVVNDNSDNSSSINIEQNIEVVNDNSDECSIVNVVADSQPVESLSSEDPPSWAEVVAMEEAATLTAPAPSMEPVQERKARSLRRSVRFAGSGLPVRLRSASRASANVARSARSSS